MLDPASLRPHYSAFLSRDRVLLTGHSHQAWPDVARAGVLESFDLAAAHVDDKWGAAAEAADAVRDAVVEQIGGRREEIALAQSSHELVTRFLSGLPLRARPRIVTTSGEFHSASRQLRRLAEEGVELVVVPIAPVGTLAERVAKEVDARTAAVVISTVLFQTSAVVPNLAAVAEATEQVGAELLLDAYHHFGALPWAPVSPRAYVSGGGYKYAQWGEGCCFLRVPSDCSLRPIYTGWFSDFQNLDGAQAAISYGATHADRFAGSTYDPTSHFRARRVIAFFRDHGMTIDALRELSLAQTTRLRDGLSEQFEVLTPAASGGFLAVRCPGAKEVTQALRARGVYVDSRGDILRLGPAPYVTSDELDRAVAELCSRRR